MNEITAAAGQADSRENVKLGQRQTVEVSGVRKTVCFRVSQENWYCCSALTPPHYTVALAPYTFASLLALFIHILFRKVHPNGIHCFRTVHHTHSVRCIVWLPPSTGWKYFSCFWCHFFLGLGLFFFAHSPRSFFYVHPTPRHKSNVIWVCSAVLSPDHGRNARRDEILLLTLVAGDVVSHNKNEFSHHAGILRPLTHSLRRWVAAAATTTESRHNINRRWYLSALQFPTCSINKYIHFSLQFSFFSRARALTKYFDSNASVDLVRGDGGGGGAAMWWRISTTVLYDNA